MVHRHAIVASAVVAAVFSLLAAGCGGGGGTSSPGVASVTTSTTAAPAAQSGLVAYSQCMRAHGLPSFPGPEGSGGIPKTQVGAVAQSDPEKFKTAGDACAYLMPNGGLAAPETAQQIRTKVADGLSFANCMRGHGVTRFPDPTSQGQLTVEMVEAQEINLHSPAVLRAVQECLPASHGELTPAKVAQALREAGG